MAPHLTEREVDLIDHMAAQGKTTSEMLRRITASRKKAAILPPELQAIRRHVNGETFCRSGPETRGRKRAWSAKNVREADRARKELYKKGKGEVEVHWNDVVRKARAPTVHRTTAKRSFDRLGHKVQARIPREKPVRTEEVEEEREDMSRVIKKRGKAFYLNKVDGIMDNKKFICPVSAAAKRWLRMRKVRFHLRSPSEGLKAGFTKPNSRKHRINPGATLNVCACIIKNRIRVWHYLPSKPWCGLAAAELYNGPIIKALKKHCGNKRKFTTIEDNDPSGYKSSAGKAAKKALKIVPLPWPRYSPDLNPLDFAIWAEVERRFAKQKAPKRDTVDAYKKRLRRVAMSLPAKYIKSVIATIPKRAGAIVDAEGGHVSFD